MMPQVSDKKLPSQSLKVISYKRSSRKRSIYIQMYQINKNMSNVFFVLLHSILANTLSQGRQLILTHANTWNKSYPLLNIQVQCTSQKTLIQTNIGTNIIFSTGFILAN